MVFAVGASLLLSVQKLQGRRLYIIPVFNLPAHRIPLILKDVPVISPLHRKAEQPVPLAPGNIRDVLNI